MSRSCKEKGLLITCLRCNRTKGELDFPSHWNVCIECAGKRTSRGMANGAVREPDDMDYFCFCCEKEKTSENFAPRSYVCFECEAKAARKAGSLLEAETMAG